MVKKDVKTLKKDFKKDMKKLNAAVPGLKKAKKTDMEYLMGKMNLEFAEPERLVEGLLGKAVLNRLQTTLRYMELARKHLPSKKVKESVPEKPRAEGMDISFPGPEALPKFWLKEAALAGLIQGVGVTGVVTSVTSNPARVGKPAIMTLAGKKGPQTFRAKVIVDHAGDVEKDSFIVEAKGLPVSQMASGGILGKALVGGTSEAEFSFMAIGETKIGGNLKFLLSGLKFDKALLLKEAGLASEGQLSFKDRRRRLGCLYNRRRPDYWSARWDGSDIQ